MNGFREKGKIYDQFDLMYDEDWRNSLGKQLGLVLDAVNTGGTVVYLFSDTHRIRSSPDLTDDEKKQLVEVLLDLEHYAGLVVGEKPIDHPRFKHRYRKREERR